VSSEEVLAAAGVVAVAVTLLFLALLALWTRPRSPDAAPSTMELRDEPPAVVDLLTDDFELTPQAVPATLVDLAARRWVGIEEYGDGDVVIRLRGNGVGQGALRPFEEQVLSHVRGLAVNGVVPAAAMTTGPEEASAGWWKRFRRMVVADVRARGLCRPRWPRAAMAVLWVGAAAAIAAAWGADRLAGEDDKSRLLEGLLFAAVAGGVLLVAVASALTSSDRQRDTEDGLAVAGQWLGVRRHLADHGDFAAKPAAAVAVWDRYLAYAVALDLAPLAVAQLPLGAEDDRHAWSRAGGHWRPVVVTYPRLRPGYGQHPVVAAFVGLVTGAIAVAALTRLIPAANGTADWVEDLSDTPRPWVRLAAAGVAVVAVAVAAWSLVKFVYALSDVFARRTVEGVVLRARVRGSGENRQRRYYMAIDTGAAARVASWRLAPVHYGSAQQGAWVRVVMTPRLCHVRSMQRLTGPPGAPVDAVVAGDDPALVAAAHRLTADRPPA
jgi:hypothetical protein